MIRVAAKNRPYIIVQRSFIPTRDQILLPGKNMCWFGMGHNQDAPLHAVLENSPDFQNESQKVHLRKARDE